MNNSYLYTLIFVFDQDEVLLVKRKKEPWKGFYNGLGGKVEGLETPEDTIIRELYEESGLRVDKTNLINCGIVTWNDYKEYKNGLHLFKVYKDLTKFRVPTDTREGLLVLKNQAFLTGFDNPLIATNIPHFFKFVVNNQKAWHHCVFNGDQLISVTTKQMKDE